MFVKYLSGKDGRITSPYLGAVVATMDGWTLTRRGESGPDAALYDLRASFSFFQRAMWEDDDWPKRIEVDISRNATYEVKQQPGYSTTFKEGQLTVEGVILAKF